MMVLDYKGKRVLSIGAKQSVLYKFSDELNRQGFKAKWTNNYTNMDTVLKEFIATEFDVIAFGRGVSSANKQLLRQKFLEQNLYIEFVDGLAPITNLLVDQIKLACKPKNMNQVNIDFALSGDIKVDCQANCNLAIKQYRLNWLFQTKENIIFDRQLEKESFTIPIKNKRGSNFIVFLQDGVVIDIRTL